MFILCLGMTQDFILATSLWNAFFSLSLNSRYSLELLCAVLFSSIENLPFGRQYHFICLRVSYSQASIELTI